VRAVAARRDVVVGRRSTVQTWQLAGVLRREPE